MQAASLEQSKAAYDLLLAVPQIMLIDVPVIEQSLKTRQSNLSILKGFVLEQKKIADQNKKEKKAPPMKAMFVTSYLAISEFKGVLDSFIDIIENIIQKKLILPIGTIIGKKDIGTPFNKVRDVLKSTSDQLSTFISTQELIIMFIDTDGATLAAQQSLLAKLS